MGKSRGKDIFRRLANMAIRPPRDPKYELPPPDECEEYSYPEHFDDGNMLKVRQMVHVGTWETVDFAFIQMTRHEGRWRRVAKIDCDRGVIHRHQYLRDSDKDLFDHRPIRKIPHLNGREIIEWGYEYCLKVMHDEWEDNLRRWRGD